LDLKISINEISINTGIYSGIIIRLYNSFIILSILSFLQFSTSKFLSILRKLKSIKL